MKRFAIDQKSLVAILASMQPICSKRTTIDTTASILFQVGHRELVMKSTDLEISLQANCPVNDSTLTQSESFLVPGKRIFEIVKEFDGLITCTIKNNQLAFKAGSVHVTLNVQDEQGFPPFPERIENLMQLDTTIFARMLDNVSFLIPQTSTQNALTGLYLEITPAGLTMTTTDGHCLAQVKHSNFKLDSARSWLLPRRAIFELKKII